MIRKTGIPLDAMMRFAVEEKSAKSAVCMKI